MITFKKQTISRPDYSHSSIPDKTISGVTFHLDGDASYFEIKIVQHYTDNTETIALWHKVLAANIKNYGAGSDYVAYGVDTIRGHVSDVDGNPTAPLVINHSEFVDIYADTYLSRSKPPFEAPYNNIPYYVFVADQTGDFSSWTVVIRVPEGANYQFAGSLKSRFDVATPVEFIKDNLPAVTLTAADSSISANSSTTITVTTDPSVKEVYLEPVYGITNKARVIMTNGVGTFKLYSTDIHSGETVRVKAGHRRYPGISSISIPVV